MSKSPSRIRARLVRAGLTAGAVIAAMLVAPQAAYAGTGVGPMVAPLGGTATIGDPNSTFNTSTTAVELSSGPCPDKYTAPGATGPWAATVTNRSANAITFTVPTTGPTVGSNGAVKPYYVCAYDATVASSSPRTGAGNIYLGTPVMVNPFSGVTGGGNQITVNANQNATLFAGLNAVAAVFTTSSCNPTLGSSNPANLVGTSVIKQPNNASVSLTVPPGVVAMNGGGPTMYSLCLYDGSGPSGGLLSMAPYNVNAVSLSPASGSYLSSVLVTASSPMAFLSGVTAPVVLVVGPGAGCPGIYSTSPMNGVTPIVVGSGSIRKVSSNRAIVTLPPLSLQNNQPTGYQLCFYSSNNTQSGSLMGTSSYTAGTVATPTGVIPAAGPAAGGNTITVVGSDFPTDPGRITATLGGTPLTNIQPINDKAFTALVSPHAAEDDVTLLVITPGGTKALPGAYSFTNPIQITPTTAPNTTSSVDVDVQGSGFMSINFGSGGSAGRVFLVNGTYNGADTGGGVLANGPVAECRNALVVTDQELVCTLQLNRRLNNTATGFFDPIGYAHSVTDISTTAGSRVIGSPSGKFSPDDVGQPNLNTNIPQKSTITAVLNSKMAVMSLPSPQAGSPITATVGGVVHSLTGTLTTTSGSATVSVAAPDSFSRADIGRLFNTGTPGIPDGTTIVAVAPGGGSATLSAPASLSTQYPLAGATVADGSSTLYSSALVSNDVGSVIGPNSLGIPAGTTISTVVANTSAGLSAAAGNGGGSGTLTLNKPISASLYAAAPVLNGAYNLVVVSNGAPNAAMTDPEYSQTDVTSGSTFTVATF